MKTFNDLVFEPHLSPFISAIQAFLTLDNGYGLSVVQGDMFYCDEDEDTYEVAILKDGKLCYDTPIADDVLAYQTPEDIDRIIEQLSAL